MVSILSYLYDNDDGMIISVILERGMHWSPIDSIHKGPVMRILDVSFDLSLHKRLNWQSILSAKTLSWCSCSGAHKFDIPSMHVS